MIRRPVFSHTKGLYRQQNIQKTKIQENTLKTQVSQAFQNMAHWGLKNQVATRADERNLAEEIATRQKLYANINAQHKLDKEQLAIDSHNTRLKNKIEHDADTLFLIDQFLRRHNATNYQPQPDAKWIVAGDGRMSAGNGRANFYNPTLRPNGIW